MRKPRRELLDEPFAVYAGPSAVYARVYYRVTTTERIRGIVYVRETIEPGTTLHLLRDLPTAEAATLVRLARIAHEAIEPIKRACAQHDERIGRNA